MQSVISRLHDLCEAKRVGKIERWHGVKADAPDPEDEAAKSRFPRIANTVGPPDSEEQAKAPLSSGIPFVR